MTGRVSLGEEEVEGESELLRDRFLLSAISIAESEAKKQGMEIAEPVVACISDMAYKFAEQLAKDVELFARHAGRRTVNAEDVILTAHRNEHLVNKLRFLADELKSKEPGTEKKKRKKPSKKDNLAPQS